MLCQNCQKNEATKIFVTNWMGVQYQVHVCDECLERMYHHAGNMGLGDNFHKFTGWWPGKEEPRQVGEIPFPKDAEQTMKFRLQLNKLRYRLEEAVKRENYEEAARLRDSITKIEQEEISHEC